MSVAPLLASDAERYRTLAPGYSDEIMSYASDLVKVPYGAPVRGMRPRKSWGAFTNFLLAGDKQE